MARLRVALLSVLLLALAPLSFGPPRVEAAIGARVISSIDVYGPVGGGTSSGTAVSSTTTYYSKATDISSLKSPSYDLYWTGTPAGTFTVQVSNKTSPILTSDADWKALTLARPITQPAGGASGDYVDLSGLPFRWVRLKYVNASGSGNIQAFLVGKE